MIIPIAKFFVSLLFFLVVTSSLVKSIKIECPITSGNLTTRYQTNQESYLILLDQAIVSTGDGGNLTSIEHHLNFLKSCWGISSESVLDGLSDTTIPQRSNNNNSNVLHVSVGGIND